MPVARIKSDVQERCLFCSSAQDWPQPIPAKWFVLGGG